MRDGKNDAWLLPWLQRGYRPEDAKRIREWLLDDKHRRQRVAQGVGHGTASEKRNRRRFAARKLQEERKRLLFERPVRWSRKQVENHQVVREPILDALFPSRRQRWKPIYERPQKVESLDIQDFSFLTHPKETIQNLARIATAEAVLSEGRLNFLDQECMDIGPYLALQSMYRGMLDVFVGGRISATVQAVLDAVGLKTALHMRFDGPTGAPVWPLPFRTKGRQYETPGYLLRTQTSEVVATQIIAGLNAWLDTAGRKLTDLGERSVLSLAGEAINNAERHSSPGTLDGTWSIAGFMMPEEDTHDGRFFFRCHLGLLSAGATIAQSIGSAAPQTLDRMDQYVRRHSSRRGLSVESLQTVFALQDGVTRDAEAFNSGRGGTGLMDIIDFFAALGDVDGDSNRQPVLSILSGQTCIIVKKPYVRGIQSEQPEPSAGAEVLQPPRELWFNRSNSPLEEPDSSHVIGLSAPLGGTLITMSWTLAPETLEESRS